jgi:hypothetical protein
MGYCINQVGQRFFIHKKNFSPALSAIKALATRTNEMSGGSWGPVFGRTASWYSWVRTEEFLNAQTLDEALQVWRWEPQIDERGNIYLLNFVGEKLGQDDILFQAIAPYVRNNSYIEMMGEDGARWRWVFRNGECVEKEGKVSFR